MKRFEDFALDAANQCLWHDGERITLPPKPFAVLHYLVDNPGRLITHDELLDKLWPQTYVQPQVLRTYVLELRKVLGDDAREPRFIESLPKRGYRFLASVTETSLPSEKPCPAPPSEASSLIGRDSELAALDSALQKAFNAQRQVLFVSGDSGIGKTALVDAFCTGLQRNGAVALGRGQCVQGLAEKEEYYPVVEALAQLCASTIGDAACKILARLAPGWLAALGHPTQDAALAKAGRVPGDLCAALEELTANHTVVLLFEDLHWADASTLDLISALARRRAPARLFLLGTCNPQHAEAEHPLRRLKQDLVVRRLSTEIALGPLSRRDVEQLLCNRWGPMPSDLPRFVYRRSEGNPLFVESIVEHLIAQGALVQTGSNGSARWELHAPLESMEASVPDELAQMIELEIQRIEPRVQRLLEAGSLSNVAFSAWAVAAALNEDLAETEEACDELARRLSFVCRVGQDELPDGSRSGFYAFTHGVYREVLYSRQASTRRAQRHARIAERLAQLFAGREADVAREIAQHQEAAGNWMLAISALRQAARSAQQRHASSQVTDLLSEAQRIAENLHGSERAAVLEELGAQQQALETVQFKSDDTV